MSFSVSEVGGLAVAFNPADKREVQRALERLDKGLFLDQELEPIGPYGPYVYWVVKHWIGSGVAPVPVLEWRDDNGPWPLTMAIVEKVRRENRSWEEVFKHILEVNRAKQIAAVKETEDAVEAIAREGYYSARGTRSVNLPRSQSLRMARDRARARGEKR